MKPNHRYQEIANRLLADIRSGKFAVGDKIPTEHAISREYGVSRNTARHAVQELERLGLISRQRGAGSVVVRADPKPAFVSSITSIKELIQYAATTYVDVRRVRPALALPIIEGVQTPRHPQDWTHAEGLRYVLGNDRPICATDIFLHPDVADIAPLIGGPQSLPVYRLIEERHGMLIHTIVQAIEAVILTGDIAKDLGVRPGSAGLKVMRAYSDSTRVLEIAVNIHPTPGFSYRMTIFRNIAAGGAAEVH